MIRHFIRNAGKKSHIRPVLVILRFGIFQQREGEQHPVPRATPREDTSSIQTLPAECPRFGSDSRAPHRPASLKGGSGIWSDLFLSPRGGGPDDTHSRGVVGSPQGRGVPRDPQKGDKKKYKAIFRGGLGDPPPGGTFRPLKEAWMRSGGGQGSSVPALRRGTAGTTPCGGGMGEPLSGGIETAAAVGFQAYPMGVGLRRHLCRHFVV